MNVIETVSRTKVAIIGREESLILPVPYPTVRQALIHSLQQGIPFVTFPKITGEILIQTTTIAAIEPYVPGAEPQKGD